LLDLLRVKSAEMVEQDEFVIAQFAQRRDGDREYAEAVVKVAAKCSGPDRIAQVAIGCGDDARAAGACRGLPDTLIFSVLQHPQQFGLEFQRQLADLVKKQRARRSVFKESGLRAGCAGEGAFAVTEQ